MRLVPLLGLSRGLAQSAFHHLDTFGHVLEVANRVERELEERETGSEVSGNGRLGGLRLAAVLHDVAKPVTRGEYEGRPIFVSHDTLGATLAASVCRRFGAPALHTDLVATLTALHLKIGFLSSKRTDYPLERLVRAAGTFGEELAALSWADRMAAQGPRLKREHVERHRSLCRLFLERSRAAAPHPEPDYEALRRDLGETFSPADAGLVACRARLLSSRGLSPREAGEWAVRLARGTLL